jgi:hypothetical protein
MKLCPTCTAPVCDFCLYFEYNGEPIEHDAKVWDNALYVEKGYCRKHDMCADPGGGCDDFKCKRLTSDEQSV